MLVYYARASFGSGIDSAVLISPALALRSPECQLTFFYQISTPKIQLSVAVMGKSRTGSRTIGVLSYNNQTTPGLWNEAAFTMDAQDVFYLVFIANKTGITAGRHYVAIDRIDLWAKNSPGGHGASLVKG